jgi:hypothetical protein
LIDDAFPDDDEMTYDPPSDLMGNWRFEAFPDQFEWTCCEGEGDAKPCRRGKHSEINKDTGSPGSSESEESTEDEDEDEDEEESESESDSEKQRHRHNHY